MLPGSRLIIALCTVLVLALFRHALADPSGQQVDTNQLIGFIEGKQSQVVNLGQPISIPFLYPSRPTVSCRLGELDLQLLVDSGTRLSILNLLTADDLPAGISSVGPTNFLADLESRETIEFDDHSLSYAEAGLLSSAGLLIRRLPLRVYTYEDELPGTDFSGSLALSSLDSRVVVFDNDAQELTLLHREEFQPMPAATAVPLQKLRGLCFARAGAGEAELLLLVDTGFSGELLLTQASSAKLGNDIVLFGSSSDSFTGFHGDTGGEAASLRQLTLSAQHWPGLAEKDVTMPDLDVLIRDGEMEETALGKLDGIIGAGLLSRYNYAIDQQRSVMFIWERK